MDQPYLSSLIHNFKLRVEEECLSRILKCLSLLNESQVQYQTNQNSNSIAQIIVHLSGNIRQYIHHALGHELDIRQRDQEFSPMPHTLKKHQLKSLISETISSAVIIVSKLNNDELFLKKKIQVFQLDSIDILIHVIEHTSYHVGQITYITKMLTDEQTYYYDSLEL